MTSQPTSPQAMLTEAGLVKAIAKAICTARGPEPQCLWHEWQVEAQAALNVARAHLSAPSWRPIETAPKDGTDILTINRDKQIAISAWFAKWDFDPRGWGPQENCWVANGGWVQIPTHWLPLPPPPSGEDDFEARRQHAAPATDGLIERISETEKRLDTYGDGMRVFDEETASRSLVKTAQLLREVRAALDRMRREVERLREVEALSSVNERLHAQDQAELTAAQERIERLQRRLEMSYPEQHAEIERLTAERDQWNADARKLSGGLLAITKAGAAVPASVLRSVAYDVALNCMDPETAAFQIQRRAALNKGE